MTTAWTGKATLTLVLVHSSAEMFQMFLSLMLRNLLIM